MRRRDVRNWARRILRACVRHLIAEMGVSQVVYGTGVSLNWPVTVDLVLHAKFLSDADKIAILSGNLQKLLRIS